MSKLQKDLATNPCVSRETTFQIYDKMMLGAEDIHTYSRAAQAKIQALADQRAHHHQGFDDTHNGAASTDGTQHDQPHDAAQGQTE